MSFLVRHLCPECCTALLRTVPNGLIQSIGRTNRAPKSLPFPIPAQFIVSDGLRTADSVQGEGTPETIMDSVGLGKSLMAAMALVARA